MECRNGGCPDEWTEKDQQSSQIMTMLQKANQHIQSVEFDQAVSINDLDELLTIVQNLKVRISEIIMRKE